MQTDLTEILQYLNDKRVVLLGNSRSIMNSKKDIDSFDVVCRINRGVPGKNAECIGTRTDVLFTSTSVSDHFLERFNAKYILWMTEDQKCMKDNIKDSVYLTSTEDWRYVRSLIPHFQLPSTGLLVIYFLIKYIDFQSLTIYGFDCFETGTWYHDIKNQKWHAGAYEKNIISELITFKENVKWIKE